MKSGYETIDEYILSFPRPVQVKLNEIRKLIRAIAPQAREKISYQMPSFHLGGNLIYFAAYAKHVGFYPGAGAIREFRQEPLPIELIKRIVKYKVEENIKKQRKENSL